MISEEERLLRNQKARDWRKANPERARAAGQRHEKKNFKKRQLKNKKWRAKNKEKVLADHKAWVERNYEHRKAWWRKHQKRNLDKARIQNHRHRARKKSLIHPDLDKARESEIYEECHNLILDTGVIHHVDHIIPLIAGGPHHHDNLQILPQSLNAGKSHDLFWQRPGYKSWRDVPEHLWPVNLRPAYYALLLI